MNIFQTVKENVTTLQAAEFYGIEVKRNGMAKCIFHNDRTPSMKVDRRYHCFGCQADGDVISFVQKLFGLSPYDAALKLAADFRIPVPEQEMKKGDIQETKDLRKTEETQKATLKDGENKGQIRKSEPETEEQKKERRIRRLERQIRSWLKRAEITLRQYLTLLEEWEKKYRPAGQEEDYHPLFIEALTRKTIIRYQLDTLLYGTDADRLDFSRRKERR